MKRTVLVSIDTIGKTIVSSVDQSILLSSNDKSLLVTGWAVDKSANELFNEIYVCLDETPHLASYKIKRPDVVDHYKNPAYESSGFRVEIPIEGISGGWHVLNVTVVGRDGIKKNGFSSLMVFRQSKKRDWWQLVLFEMQRLKSNPARFLERSVAASRHIFREGLGSFLDYYLNRMYHTSDNVLKYKQWISRHESAKIWKTQHLIRFKNEPLISIIVPVYETHPEMLTAMILSVIDQTYHRWELCIADGASPSGDMKKILKTFELKDQRIKVVYLSENQGISGNSNAAIIISHGDFIALLDHDDLLSPDALFEMVEAINEYDDVDLLYSDEDNISNDGQLRMNPYFKPDFSIDTLRTGNYISHFLVIRKSLGNGCGWFRSEFDGAQDYDLVLRACERSRRIVHVPRVLYHWRAHGGSTALGLNVKTYAEDAGKRALKEHLKRVGLQGEVENGAQKYLYKINYSLNAQPPPVIQRSLPRAATFYQDNII